jgi:hypothetical protein
MGRSSCLILVFSVVFATLLISPAFLNRQFGPYPLMKTGDVTDILTPLLLIPLYWLVYQIGRDKAPGPGESVAFLILAAFWVEGQGMHLSANSIGHLLGKMDTGDVHTLAHFYDEVLSHYLWHIGVVGLSALLVWRQWQQPYIGERLALWPEGVAGLIHGLTYFIIVVEARTAPLGVPFAALIVLFGLAWGRTRLRRQPLLAFFFVAYLVATILFVYWAIRWTGSSCSNLLPEFSDPCVGFID